MCMENSSQSFLQPKNFQNSVVSRNNLNVLSFALREALFSLHWWRFHNSSKSYYNRKLNLSKELVPVHIERMKRVKQFSAIRTKRKLGKTTLWKVLSFSRIFLSVKWEKKWNKWSARIRLNREKLAIAFAKNESTIREKNYYSRRIQCIPALKKRNALGNENYRLNKKNWQNSYFKNKSNKSCDFCVFFNKYYQWQIQGTPPSPLQ